MGHHATVPRLLLLRHGESTWNAEGRWQGWADPPLSEEGREAAEVAARWLAAGGIDAVACSDLRRAADTAAVIAAASGAATPYRDARLRERDMGCWSGLRTPDIAERWPGVLDAWQAGALDRPPGGESTASVLARARAGLRHVAAAADHGPDATIVVVTHGGVMSALERDAGLPRVVRANLTGRWIEVSGAGLRFGETTAPPRLP